MSKLIPKLTIVALLVHMVLGCCWHHRHNRRLELAQPVAASSFQIVCRSHRCEDRHRHENQPSGKDQGDRHGCDGGRCVFVGAQPVRIETAPEAQSREFVTAAAVGNAGLPAESNLFCEALAATKSHSPIPLHLLNQALLL